MARGEPLKNIKWPPIKAGRHWQGVRYIIIKAVKNTSINIQENEKSWVENDFKHIG